MKKLLAIGLAALMAVFAGCGKEDEPEAEIYSETETQSVTNETEIVTAMGNIIITRADTVFEESTDKESTAKETTTEEKTSEEETTQIQTTEMKTQTPETQVQPQAKDHPLVGEWEYIYENGAIVQEIFIYEDGTASYRAGYVASEYSFWYDGTWREENGTVYFDLIGGDAEMGDPEEIEEPTDSFNMKLGWKEHANGITFIDYDDSLIIGDGAGAEYNFVPRALR